MTDPASEPTSGPARWWDGGPVRAALVVVVAVVFGGVLWWQFGGGFSPRPARLSSVLAPAAVAVAPGVYLLGKTSPAAVYLVETSQGLVLIDSGLEASAGSVLRQLTELRFDVRDLRAILLTHAHADHSLGANHLRSLSGARVHAGAADCAILKKGGPREAFFSTFEMPQLSPHPTAVDVELGPDEEVAFGETRFTALATPGHTPGSVCYLMRRGGLTALFTGDVVQTLHKAAGADLGTYAAYLPPLYRGSARDYRASLARLRGMAAPDLVLPGHPRMGPAPQSPRLGEQAWRALLDGGIAEMDRLLVRYRADGEDFLDGKAKELLPGLRYLGDVGRSAVYCLDSPKGLLLFDAPGGPGLLALLEARFKELGWAGRKPAAVLLTSAGPEATAGLEALVRQSGCPVVAPGAAVEEVRRLCPAGTRLLTEGDLAGLGVEAEVIPLAGRGVAPVAYQLRWAGKTVLVSGRIPVKPSGPALERLTRDVTGPGGSARGYRESLARLAREAPDLWLPAEAVYGQNANLYDRDWAHVLARNVRATSW